MGVADLISTPFIGLYYGNPSCWQVEYVNVRVGRWHILRERVNRRLNQFGDGRVAAKMLN
jgi:hypothetical protein